MKKESIKEDIQETSAKLLEMGRKLSGNKISNNRLYIFSEIRDIDDLSNFSMERKLRKKDNGIKTPVILEKLSPVIENLYENLYDLNLYIYRSLKEYTIIDIRYYPKSSLEPGYRRTVQDNEPMLHCKTAIPPYLLNPEQKFDINWEHKIWNYRWKMFWLRKKVRS